MNRVSSLLAVLAALASCVLSAPACAKTPAVRRPPAASTPPPGSAERKAILDALCVPVERSYHAHVVFVVSYLKAGAGYAYVDAVAQRPNGKPFADQDEGTGGFLSAMLQKQGGRWRVLKWGSYGGTDLIDECRKKYPRAPAGLLPNG